MQKKRMLITGISGLLGNNIAYCLKDTYDIVGLYHTHQCEMDGIRTVGMDLTSCKDVHGLIEEIKPEIIIHCAAQADVDTCEVSPQDAERINVLGTRNLVESLNDHQMKFISISTDLVYDGKKGHFSEGDLIHPVNCYGKTKYKSEQEALKRENVLILRTNFFGWNIQDKLSLGEWAINELSRKNKIQGFTDCIFSAMYTFELAKVLDAAIKKDISGIYNCASSTSMSKYEFILEIADRLDFDKSLINPILLDDFRFKAKRCKNLSLDISKLADDLSINIPSMSSSIDSFVEDFKKGFPGIIRSSWECKNIYPASSDLIPYGRQCIDEDDIAAVVDVLKSKSITQGPKIQEFESAVCGVTEASFAVSVNSGTSALHIACLAAGVGSGDEVITSPNTFVASANCAVYCGGKPVFVDIDPRTYNLSPVELEKKINEKTKAVIPVHFAGQSCDMEAILDIVKAGEKKYGHKIYIIEDACHALGSRYKNAKVGLCKHSNMAVMSFHPVKHITTGEGGAVLTSDNNLYKKLITLRSHGITGNSEEFVCREDAFEKGEDGDEPIRKRWYYEQKFLGHNYRMTEIQCALGISQLKKLDKFCQKRREIVEQYNAAFKDIEWLTVPFEEEFCDSNFHLYVLLFDFKKIGIGRAHVMAELLKKGIQTQAHYIPVYTQPYYRKNFGTDWGNCPVAEQYYKGCLSIPLYPTMSDKDVKGVISGVKGLVRDDVAKEVFSNTTSI